VPAAAAPAAGTSPAPAAPPAPIRLAEPTLGEGSHKSYAVQWFAFAAIALIGVGTLVYQDNRATRGRV
jgi:cytochrome oxidase assembly protein ShyY1